MKRYIHWFLLFPYLLMILHSMVPHCHGECRDDVSDHCNYSASEEDESFLHLLTSFFSNTAHIDENGEITCHLQVSTDQSAETRFTCRTAFFGYIGTEPGISNVEFIHLINCRECALDLACGRTVEHLFDRGPPILT